MYPRKSQTSTATPAKPGELLSLFRALSDRTRAPVHAADERIWQARRLPSGGCRPLCCTLQFLPGPRSFAHDAGNGAALDGSYLDDRRVADPRQRAQEAAQGASTVGNGSTHYPTVSSDSTRRRARERENERGPTRAIRTAIGLFLLVQALIRAAAWPPQFPVPKRTGRAPAKKVRLFLPNIQNVMYLPSPEFIKEKPNVGDKAKPLRPLPREIARSRPGARRGRPRRAAKAGSSRA